MFTSRLEHKHWMNVAGRFLTDLLLFFLGFELAMVIRFGDDWRHVFIQHWYPPAVGAVVASVLLYICGYYVTTGSSRLSLPKRILLLLVIVGVSSMVVLITPYVFLEKPPGRGIWAMGMAAAYVLLGFHHVILNYVISKNRLSAAIIVSCYEDESEAINLYHNCKQFIDLKGIIVHGDMVARNQELPVLGTTAQADTIARSLNLNRVICSNRGMAAASLFRKFCELQYLGVSVSSAINIYEEFHQICPITLLSSEWMLQASTAPQILYIRKLKRSFDITVSILGLVFLGPILLVAIVLQKIFCKGPVFYRQLRLGRFGRQFEVVKIRTMRVDAEKDGAKWSASNDPRVTVLGGLFRKYRIDEIPQLLNVLRGEMSFVGPRPERPEFTDMLSDEIPFFLERLLVQPGLTGWAQVNYPYGESIDDSRRKLEYDLYYIKHMSTFFDLFLLLDTIRIILTGGSRKPPQLDFSIHKFGKVRNEHHTAMGVTEPSRIDVHLPPQ